MAKQRNPEATCGNCVYFVPADEEYVSLCARFPPSVVDKSGENIYPEVPDSNDACGEHPNFFLKIKRKRKKKIDPLQLD